MTDDSTQYIARISYGKDSLKMLDIIRSRGMPLDRITTTEVWATDTISANLPPMQDFKERMDQWIWDRYRIEVEHLCAVNPDGTKRTYEQMFYHVPKRRSQDIQVERERAGTEPERCSDGRLLGASGVRTSSGRVKGFPSVLHAKWCQKLKNEWLPRDHFSMVPKAQDRQGADPFYRGGTRLARKKQKSWNTSASRLMSRSGLDSSTNGKEHHLWNSTSMRSCVAFTVATTAS